VETGQPTAWRKSSYCGSAACVEIAKTDDMFLVRDSKDPESPVLAFTQEEWSAFIAGVNAGEFSA
jgi:hypothetical protein